MSTHTVGSVEEFSDGSRKTILVEGKEITVFRRDGEFYAILNWCPHQSGPLCEGMVTGTTSETFDRDTLESDLEWIKDGEIIVCPWHGWQFDMDSGDSMSDPDISVPTYPVEVEGETVTITL